MPNGDNRKTNGYLTQIIKDIAVLQATSKVTHDDMKDVKSKVDSMSDNINAYQLRGEKYITQFEEHIRTGDEWKTEHLKDHRSEKYKVASVGAVSGGGLIALLQVARHYFKLP